MKTLSIVPGLTARPLGDELIVHDRRNAAVHHLNAAATAVWRAIEAGADAASLTDATGLPAAEAQLALDSLVDAGLVVAPGDPRLLSRRRMLQTAGVLAGAGFVTTVVLPTAAAAATGTPTGTLPGPGQAVVVSPGQGFYYSAISGTHTYSVQVIGAGGGAGAGDTDHAGAGGYGAEGAVATATMTITYPGTVFISAATAGASSANGSTGNGGTGGSTTQTSGAVTQTGGTGGAYSTTGSIYVDGTLMYPGGGGGGYSFASGAGQVLVAGGGGAGGGSGYVVEFDVNATKITYTTVGPLNGEAAGTAQDPHSAGQAGSAGKDAGAGGGGGGSTAGTGGSYTPRAAATGGSSGLYGTSNGLVSFASPTFAGASTAGPVYGQGGVPNGNSATGGQVVVSYIG